jgi:hypothetical protein
MLWVFKGGGMLRVFKVCGYGMGILGVWLCYGYLGVVVMLWVFRGVVMFWVLKGCGYVMGI